MFGTEPLAVEPVAASPGGTAANTAQSDAAASDSPVKPPMLIAWLQHDLPYIAMLVLALVGIVLALPLDYWLFLVPVFAALSIFAGWRHFGTSARHGELIYQMLLNWGALFVAVLLLFQSSGHGVMNSNASLITMMILLALGTFTAGVQARVWRISVVGGLLFLAVPAMNVLVQSALLWTVAIVVIVILGFLAWWIYERTELVAPKTT